MKKWQLISLPILDLLILGLTFLPMFQIEALSVSGYRISEMAVEYFGSGDPMRYFVFSIYLVPLISIWQFVDILTEHAWQLLTWIQLVVVLTFLGITLFNNYPFDLDPQGGMYAVIFAIVIKLFIQFRGGSSTEA